MNYQAGGSECAGPTSSNSSWTNSHYHTFARLMNGGPPSPCPSDHPFNSASSSLSESSSSHRSQEDDISIVTGNIHSSFLSPLWFRTSTLRDNPAWEKEAMKDQERKKEKKTLLTQPRGLAHSLTD